MIRPVSHVALIAQIRACRDFWTERLQKDRALAQRIREARL